MRYSFILLAWLPGLGYALHIDLVVTSDQTEQIEQFLLSQLPSGIQLQTLSENDKPRPESNWLITVGNEHISWARKYHKNYTRIVLFHVSENALKQHATISNSHALVTDQPLERQFALAKVLFPRSNLPAVLTNRKTNQQQSELPYLVLGTDSHWQQELSQQMLAHDLLLVSEQEVFYQKKVAHAVLLTAYRQRKPVIGPGERYVAAGAIASCYTTLGQYLDQLLDILVDLNEGKTVPSLQYPRLFQVITNRPVIRSMGLSVPDDAELTQQVYTLMEMSP